MLTAKIYLLRRKLEDLGVDRLKMGINCPTTCQDVNFVGNSNGFCPNQGFNSGWNKTNLLFGNF
jgi:hypothetical protein